jgi:hypothetical protein
MVRRSDQGGHDLLLDLLASGDSGGVTGAFELFTRLVEQAVPDVDSRESSSGE